MRGISLSPDGHHLAIASEEAAVLFVSHDITFPDPFLFAVYILITSFLY